jgi:hypothetical protein
MNPAILRYYYIAIVLIVAVALILFFQPHASTIPEPHVPKPHAQLPHEYGNAYATIHILLFNQALGLRKALCATRLNRFLVQ